MNDWALWEASKQKGGLRPTHPDLFNGVETLIKNREGFWATSTTPRLPIPEQGKRWKGQAEFLRSLGRVESVSAMSRYRGITVCRLCQHSEATSHFNASDWEWPRDLTHYVRVHNHKPTAEFITFITRNAKALNEPFK